MANRLSFDHSDRRNPYRVDGQPVTYEQYMAAPMYTGLKRATLHDAYETWHRTDDEVGSRTAFAVVERIYGKDYAMEIGRNR